MRRARRALAFSLLSCFLILSPAGAHEAADGGGEGHPSFGSRPDAHAPLGVMGDHMHHAGEFMVSYRYARMRMEGNRDGTERLDPEEVLQGFMVAPLDMDMQMHLFGFMYAPTDWVTLMAMLPLVELSMDHLTRMGDEFTTENDGIGDLRLTGLLRLWENEHHHVHANLGMSFPTGTIRAKDATPADPNTTLPFPMQIGSGTFDLLPGITYVGHTDRFSWGSQVVGTARLGENSAGWTAGNRVDFTGWVAYPWTKWLSTSVRFGAHWWSNYDGDEPRPPPPPTIPTARPDLRGGTSVDLLGGINLLVPLGRLLGKHRFAIEGGAPLEQWLDGPQLETDWRFVVGWQKAF